MPGTIAAKDILNETYESLGDKIQYKLLTDCQNGKINKHECREISRAIGTVFNHLHILENVRL
jgi:hypothetical protein